MIDIATVGAALGMGLFGSPHCLGMCGGIVGAFQLSIKQQSWQRRLYWTTLYHMGRLSAYALMGACAASLGMLLLDVLSDSYWPRKIVALIFIIIGFSMLGWRGLDRFEHAGAVLWQYLSPIRQKLFPIVTAPRAFAAGVIWGFLPCGLVYGALLMAFTQCTAMQGASIMAFFWIGTLPLLIFSAAITQRLAQFISATKIRSIQGIIMIIFGLLTAFPIMLGHHH